MMQCWIVPVLEALNCILPQEPGVDELEDVNVILLPDVPTAFNVPSIIRFIPELNSTVMPGLIVRVTPGLTVTSPITVLSILQVVLAVIFPETLSALASKLNPGKFIHKIKIVIISIALRLNIIITSFIWYSPDFNIVSSI
jgi:hypothetical protein